MEEDGPLNTYVFTLALLMFSVETMSAPLTTAIEGYDLLPN
jgi:hypothetical protein